MCALGGLLSGLAVSGQSLPDRFSLSSHSSIGQRLHNNKFVRSRNEPARENKH